MYKVYIDDKLFCKSDSSELAIMDPVVSLEVNKAGTFTFTVNPDHAYYDDITVGRSLVKVYQNSEVIFDGIVKAQTVTFYKQKKVECEGCLTYLNDSIQRQAQYTGKTSRELLTAYLHNHNQQLDTFKKLRVGTVTAKDSNDSISCYTNMESTMKCIKEDLLDDIGGYIRVRTDGSNHYVDYLADSPRTSGQIIRIGRNLMDLSQNMDSTDVATVCIPLGCKLEEATIPALGQRLDITSVNDGKDYVVSTDAMVVYGKIERVVTWDGVTTASELKSKAEAWLTDNQWENLVITATAIDLSMADDDFDNFRLLDKIRVVSEPHGLDRYFICSAITYNLNAPETNTITLGKKINRTLSAAAYEYAEEVKEEIPDSEGWLEQAQANATQLMLNGGKGHVYFDYDEDNVIRQILIMDTNSPATATKAWVWNENGFGYGTRENITDDFSFSTAMTMDGKIVADFITTGSLTANIIKSGTMSANRIRAGKLVSSDENNDFSLDMTTGTVNMKNANITGGSINIDGESATQIIKLNIDANSGAYHTPGGSSYKDSYGKTTVNTFGVTSEGLGDNASLGAVKITPGQVNVEASASDSVYLSSTGLRRMVNLKSKYAYNEDAKIAGGFYPNGQTVDPLGTVKTSRPSESITIANETWRYCLCSITLTKGTWLMLPVVRFSKNGTGFRALEVNTNQSATSHSSDISANATDGSVTKIHTLKVITVTEESKMFYLFAYQNSGGNLTVSTSDTGMTAIKVG